MTRRAKKCRRADCRHNRVSAEIAAVVIAADRVADQPTHRLMTFFLGQYVDSIELKRLRETVILARAAAERRK